MAPVDVNTPNYRPRTFAEFRLFLSNIPTEFNTSKDDEERLREVTGIN